MALTDGIFRARKTLRLGSNKFIPGDLVLGSEFSDDNQVRRYIRNGYIDIQASSQGEVDGPGVFTTLESFQEQGPSGRELDYAESAAAQSGISAVTDVTGLSVTFEVTDRPVYVEAYLPGVYGTQIGVGVQLYITDAANAIKQQAGFQCSIAVDVRQIVCKERIATPGEYTRKARLYRNAPGSPTGTIGNGFDLDHVKSHLSVIER